MDRPGWIIGRKIPCPSCNPGGARGAFPPSARVQPTPTPAAGEPWTPAQTAQVLKTALYIVAGLAAWFFYRHFESDFGVQEGDALEANASAPNGDDYSPWEPEQ